MLQSMYNVRSLENLRSALTPAHLRAVMLPSRHVSVVRVIICTALLFATLLVFGQKHQGDAKTASRTTKTGTSSPVQSFRNIGKAYYEQGKYVEAIEQFQKVVASGKAMATDHL